MAPPKGHKPYPGGELGGRPRIHDRDKVADDLVIWAAEGQSINLNKFCALYDPPIVPRRLCEWATENDRLKEAMDIAKAFIAFRREQMLNQGDLHVKAYDLNATVYDYFVKCEKYDNMKFEASLKAQEQQSYTAEDKSRFDALMSQFSSLQRNTDNNTSNTEQKS